LVDLYKLYDKRRDTATIRTLRDRVRSEDNLKYPLAVEQANAAIAGVEPIWQRVKTLRHKLYAHRASDGDWEHWFKKAGLTPNMLFDIHSFSKTAVERLSHARDGSSHAFNLEGPGEFYGLLDELVRTRN
jgi:AbiU2